MNSNSIKRSHRKCIVCGGNEPEQKYHSIPSNPFMRNKWLEACGLQASAIENMKRPMICTLHFKNDYTQNNSKVRTKLRKTAVPSLRLNESELNVDMNASANADNNSSAANADNNGEEIMDSRKRCHMKCIVYGGNDPQRKYHSESELNVDKNYASATNADDNATPLIAETSSIYKKKSKNACVLCPRKQWAEVDMQYSYHSYQSQRSDVDGGQGYGVIVISCCRKRDYQILY